MRVVQMRSMGRICAAVCQVQEMPQNQILQQGMPARVMAKSSVSARVLPFGIVLTVSQTLVPYPAPCTRLSTKQEISLHFMSIVLPRIAPEH